MREDLCLDRVSKYCLRNIAPNTGFRRLLMSGGTTTSSVVGTIESLNNQSIEYLHTGKCSAPKMLYVSSLSRSSILSKHMSISDIISEVYFDYLILPCFFFC